MYIHALLHHYWSIVQTYTDDLVIAVEHQNIQKCVERICLLFESCCICLFLLRHTLLYIYYSTNRLPTKPTNLMTFDSTARTISIWYGLTWTLIGGAVIAPNLRNLRKKKTILISILDRIWLFVVFCPPAFGKAWSNQEQSVEAPHNWSDKIIPATLNQVPANTKEETGAITFSSVNCRLTRCRKHGNWYWRHQSCHPRREQFQSPDCTHPPKGHMVNSR
jgi:hypothetical protein